MLSPSLTRVKREIKKILKHPDQSNAHRWPHTKRVLNNSRLLAEKAIESGVPVNLENLLLAGLGHDIVQRYHEDKVEHVEASIEAFRAILEKNGYTEKRMEEILKIMSEHSSEAIRRPGSIEAIILFIADKWDGVGQEGINRAIAYGAQHNMSLAETVQWYKEKIEKTKPLFLELIKEIPGSEIALKNLRYSLEAIEEFEKENPKPAI